MDKRAFTLIELLVVIAIIGILSGFIVVSMNGATDSAQIAKTRVWSNSLRDTLGANLVSEWNFDLVSGTVNSALSDSTAVLDGWGVNAGATHGTITLRSGRDCVSGQCLDFNGAGYVSCGNIASPSAGTMSVWINPSGTYSGSQYIMSGNTAGTDSQARYRIGVVHTTACAGSWHTTMGNGLTSQWVCSGEVYNATNFPAGKWVFLTITYDGSNVRFYKNGALVNTVPQTVSGAGDAQPFSIGKIGNYAGMYFYGMIDEARIYSSSLSASVIKEQYYAGLNNLLASGSISQSEYLRIKNETAEN